MNSFDFNTLFLDSVYKDTFERYCIRKRLITKTFDESHSSDISDLELIKTPLKGIKKLLVWLTLFEYVDSNSSIYDFTKLIDIGLIKESNFLSQSVDDSEVYCDEYVNAAKSLMKIYKHDVIKHIKNKDKQELHDLQVRSESRDFWKTIDASQRLFLCSDNLGNPLNLDKDYDKIIDSVDDLSGVATCFDNFQHKLDIGLILSRNISLDIGSIRDNLIEGLYHSDNNKMTYVSGLFSNVNHTFITEYIDSIYYTVKASLPNEVNVLPMPQSIEEVIKMRKSPYIKSFRSVMQEWSHYVNQGEYLLAEKIRKDLVKANTQLEKLERYKRFSISPYVRIFNLIGGQIPVLGSILGVISFIEPTITNHIQNKNGWVLLTKDH